MKLSEILGWEKKRSENQEMVGVSNSALNSVVNTSLTSCDREVDRESLARALYNLELECAGTKWEETDGWEKEVFFARADVFISTMPTWLKPTERK